MKKALGVRDLKDVVALIRSALRSDAKHAYLFGSVASNSAIPFQSDVDLLILPKEKLSAKKAHALLDGALTRLLDRGLVLHAIVFDQRRHPPELFEAAKKGVAVF